jgi:hypothetical protein
MIANPAENLDANLAGILAEHLAVTLAVTLGARSAEILAVTLAVILLRMKDQMMSRCKLRLRIRSGPWLRRLTCQVCR